MALISSGCGIGVGVAGGIVVGVDVCVCMKAGAEVKAWVGATVGDDSCEAEFVPMQAEKVRLIIHRIPINFIFFICSLLLWDALDFLSPGEEKNLRMISETLRYCSECFDVFSRG